MHEDVALLAGYHHCAARVNGGSCGCGARVWKLL